MKVKINSKTYDFNVDGVWGAIYTYEEVAGNKLPFDPTKTLCLHLLFWCILLRSNEEFDLSLEDFFEALNDLALASSLMSYYRKRMDILTASTADDKEVATQENKKKD